MSAIQTGRQPESSARDKPDGIVLMNAPTRRQPVAIFGTEKAVAV
jgi:hypothetical protein